nr:immunoglobulin light chain junction region [Macaca mulatta]MPN98534.1 immunoglobulin light chain junction region [Macaca mulatta]
CQKYSSSPYSV